MWLVPLSAYFSVILKNYNITPSPGCAGTQDELRNSICQIIHIGETDFEWLSLYLDCQSRITTDSDFHTDQGVTVEPYFLVKVTLVKCINTLAPICLSSFAASTEIHLDLEVAGKCFPCSVGLVPVPGCERVTKPLLLSVSGHLLQCGRKEAEAASNGKRPSEEGGSGTAAGCGVLHPLPAQGL